MFSETLLDHFQTPRNVGEMHDADAEAMDENPVCGDRLHLWLRIRDGVIEEMCWRAEGCAPAIAAASVTSEVVRGMSLAEASRIEQEAIADALGGLPPRKAHASLLATSALRKAIAAYTGESEMS